MPEPKEIHAATESTENKWYIMGVEALATPLTYAITIWLKRFEREDYYDHHTNFGPFRSS